MIEFLKLYLNLLFILFELNSKKYKVSQIAPNFFFRFFISYLMVFKLRVVKHKNFKKLSIKG